jgi:hypothetical protein
LTVYYLAVSWVTIVPDCGFILETPLAVVVIAVAVVGAALIAEVVIPATGSLGTVTRMGFYSSQIGAKPTLFGTGTSHQSEAKQAVKFWAGAEAILRPDRTQ